MWQKIDCRPCPRLSLWWFSITTSQQNQRRHSRSPQRDMPQCKHRTSIAATLWRVTHTQNSQLPRWSLSGCEGSGVLGRPASMHFFDIRVFNPLAASNHRLPLPQSFLSPERETRIAYEQRVHEVEHGSFTLLVLAATSGMGEAATVSYGQIACLIATKRAQPYCQVIGWLRCVLGFNNNCVFAAHRTDSTSDQSIQKLKWPSARAGFPNDQPNIIHRLIQLLYIMTFCSHFTM